MKEIPQNKLICTHFVEEEIVIDVKYVNAGVGRMMLIDSGTPKSISCLIWLKGYLRDAKVSKEEVKKKNCARRFGMGIIVYLCEKEVTFPIVLKTGKDDFVKREVVANVIILEEVNFLCGKNYQRIENSGIF